MQHIEELEATLDLLESRLSSSSYLACDTFSLADLTYLCYFAQFERVGLADKLVARPALAAWWRRCEARPAWKYAMNPSEIMRRAKNTP